MTNQSKVPHRIYCNSNYKMFCFVCNKTIERGDEITQCLESGGMELRKVPYTGSRWVHSFCVPKNIITLYYLNTVKELQDEYPNYDEDEIYDIVENHDYWIHEEDCKVIRPPTPPQNFKNYEYKNPCLECGISMGPQNPRQLCGKYRCLNIDNISDISSENDSEEIENSNINKEFEKLNKELEKMLYWSNIQASKEEKKEIILRMKEEKKVFDEIVDNTLKMLDKN